MKRYKVILILAGAIVAAFIAGRTFGEPVSPPQPVTLTVHTKYETRTVRAKYVDMTFDNGTVQLEYSSDRIFCDSFVPGTGCYLVLP